MGVSGLAALAATLLLVQEPSRSLAVDDPAWELGGAVERVEYRGVRAFRIGTGDAIRRDVSFEDGTIELDVALNGLRSFVYLFFRAASDDEREEIYLRPHKTRLPDAIQYAPVFRGQSAWQLYHGPGGTAAAELSTGDWLHVRLVVQGRRAALFLGGGSKPVMVVPRLARAPAAGFLALHGFIPRGGSAPEAAYFANVVVRPGVVPVDFARYPSSEPVPSGVVDRWEISAPFPLDSGVVERLAARPAEWRVVAAEPSGLLELDRYVARPAPRSAILTRLRVRARSAGTRVLELGFSDDATVFLDGRPIFSARSSYSFDHPRRDGVIGLDQAMVYLPLAVGEHEIVVAVVDSFGGWGLMGRWRDATGLAPSR